MDNTTSASEEINTPIGGASIPKQKPIVVVAHIVYGLQIEAHGYNLTETIAILEMAVCELKNTVEERNR